MCCLQRCHFWDRLVCCSIQWQWCLSSTCCQSHCDGTWPLNCATSTTTGFDLPSMRWLAENISELVHFEHRRRDDWGVICPLLQLGLGRFCGAMNCVLVLEHKMPIIGGLLWDEPQDQNVEGAWEYLGVLRVLRPSYPIKSAPVVTSCNNNKNNNHDYIYSAVFIAEPLREFTRFTRWIQKRRQVAADLWTKPTCLSRRPAYIGSQ